MASCVYAFADVGINVSMFGKKGQGAGNARASCWRGDVEGILQFIGLGFAIAADNSVLAICMPCERESTSAGAW